jgi:hypothetical protein
MMAARYGGLVCRRFREPGSHFSFFHFDLGHNHILSNIGISTLEGVIDPKKKETSLTTNQMSTAGIVQR